MCAITATLLILICFSSDGQSFHPSASTSPTDLRASASNSLSVLYSGKSTNANWSYSPGSTSCWIYPVDLSGLSIDGVNGSRAGTDLSLITTRHCICTRHLGITLNSPVVFRGVDGLAYANIPVSCTNYSGSDLLLVTLASNVPPAVHPFMVLPSQATNNLPGGSLRGLNVAWYQNTSGKMQSMEISGNAGTSQLIGFLLTIPNSPFWTGSGVSGDSAGPAFLVLDGRPVLLFTLYSSLINGPNLAYRPIQDWIIMNIGTNKLTYADFDFTLSTRTRYP